MPTVNVIRIRFTELYLLKPRLFILKQQKTESERSKTKRAIQSNTNITASDTSFPYGGTKQAGGHNRRPFVSSSLGLAAKSHLLISKVIPLCFCFNGRFPQL